MVDKLKEIFVNYNFLTPNDLFTIASASRLKRFQKGDLLSKSDNYNYQIFIVLKGLLRHYIIDNDGIDKTLVFIPEKQPSSNVETIFNDLPSIENIMALEDSIVLSLNNRKLEKLALKSKGLLRLQNKILKKVIIDSVERARNHIIQSPEERYEFFCQEHPNLEQRIKQKYLASYLGITPTSLSRLRARQLNNR